MLSLFRRKKKRQIFQYWDGYNKVFGDPLAIQNTLDFHPVYRADKHPQEAQQSKTAWDICVSAYREAFQLRPFDCTTGNGLTDTEVCNLTVQFNLYLAALKKNIVETQTLMQSTDAISQNTESPTTNDTQPIIFSGSDNLTEPQTLPDLESNQHQLVITTKALLHWHGMKQVAKTTNWRVFCGKQNDH